MEDSVTNTFEGCSVIFRNIKEYYSPDGTIECKFSVRENCPIHEPEHCFVGLFHVGWETLSSCVTKKSFSLIECLENDLYFTEFSPTETPQANADEFFQFCFYNISSEVVFGASCPFQICDMNQTESFMQIGDDSFSKSGSDWWVNGVSNPIDEDLSDTVVVHNKTTLLEEALAKFVEENELLKLAAVKHKSEKKDYEKNSEFEITELKQEISILHERETMLRSNVTDSEKLINCLNENIEKMKAAIIAEYEGKMAELMESNNFIMEKLKFELNEKEVIAHKLSEVSQNNERNEEIVVAQKQSIEDVISQCKMLESKLALEREQKNIFELNLQTLKAQLEVIKGDETEVVEDLKKRLADSQHKLEYEKKLHSELILEASNLSTMLEHSTTEIKNNDLKFHDEKQKMADALQEKDEFINKLSDDLKVSGDKIVLLEKKSKEVETDQAAIIVHLEEKISELETQIESQKEQFLHETKDLQRLLQQREENIKELHDALDKLAEHKAVLRDQLESVQQDKDELTDKLTSTEEMLHELKLEKSSNPKSLDAGARHALQIANAHMQKQLRSLKKEKDTYQKICKDQYQSTPTEEELTKENAEMKLRLCMGKKAYEEKYKECQKLKIKVQQLENKQQKTKLTDSCVQIDASVEDQHAKIEREDYVEYLLRENEKYAKKCSKLQQEMQDYKEHESTLFDDLEGMKKNSKILADHYESKMNLLQEENNMLKKQKDAWHKGASLFQSQDVIEKQPATKIEPVIYHPPSAVHKTVIEEQPHHSDNIMYPPSFKDEKAKNAWLSSQKKGHKGAEICRNPVQEPSPQFMPSRKSKKDTAASNPQVLNSHRNNLDSSVRQCPMCDLDLPPGLSQNDFTLHVNAHFTDN